MAFKGTGMPAANSPPSEEGSGSKDSEAAAATPVSCVDAFDALWFCYSPAHQVRSSRLNLAQLVLLLQIFLHRLCKTCHAAQFTQYYRTGLPDTCTPT
jgi:hypothetical protein